MFQFFTWGFNFDSYCISKAHVSVPDSVRFRLSQCLALRIWREIAHICPEKSLKDNILALLPAKRYSAPKSVQQTLWRIDFKVMGKALVSPQITPSRKWVFKARLRTDLVKDNVHLGTAAFLASSRLAYANITISLFSLITLRGGSGFPSTWGNKIEKEDSRYPSQENMASPSRLPFPSLRAFSSSSLLFFLSFFLFENLYVVP